MSRVFISYAREDDTTATRLYQDLKAQGASPWMDKFDLIGGQGWRGSIRQAVRRSSHFIPLISKSSVSKRGYVQREMREAIDRLQELSPDEIYIIPVRLDETESAFDDIQALHRIDLFPTYEDGLEQISRALRESGAIAVIKRQESKQPSSSTEPFNSYRVLFDRPAFQFPCIFEYALPEIQHAIDDVSTALATGKLYSRNRNLVLDLYHASQLLTQEDQSALRDIRVLLSSLRRPIDLLVQLLHIRTRGSKHSIDSSFHHMEFHLADLIRGGLSQEALVEAVSLMDQIDQVRNGILKRANEVFRRHGVMQISLITLSSYQIELSQQLEENNGRGSQRWDDYYLRLHKRISEHLAVASNRPPAVDDAT